MSRLPLGQLYFTSHALDTLDYADAMAALNRHARGDWGDVCSADWSENDWSAGHGERVLSCYTDHQGTKFWIITERDRSITTIMLTEDY